MVQWSNMRIHSTGAVSSIPPFVKEAHAIGQEVNGKLPHKIHLPMKISDPFSGNARDRTCNEDARSLRTRVITGSAPIVFQKVLDAEEAKCVRI